MADVLKSYRVDLLAPPDERLQHRRYIQAADDAQAIKSADQIWDSLVADPSIKLDRYVLYEGERVVHERLAAGGS